MGNDYALRLSRAAGSVEDEGCIVGTVLHIVAELLRRMQLPRRIIIEIDPIASGGCAPQCFLERSAKAAFTDEERRLRMRNDHSELNRRKSPVEWNERRSHPSARKEKLRNFTPVPGDDSNPVSRFHAICDQDRRPAIRREVELRIALMTIARALDERCFPGREFTPEPQ